MFPKCFFNESQGPSSIKYSYSVSMYVCHIRKHVSLCSTFSKMCLQKVPSVWLTDTLFTVGPVLINFQAENVLLKLFLGLNAGPQLLHTK